MYYLRDTQICMLRQSSINPVFTHVHKRMMNDTKLIVYLQ